MPSLPIKTYSPEELRLLAAEGRLKGRNIDRLVNLRPDRPVQDRKIGRPAFERLIERIPCWTDPLALLSTFLDLVHIHSPSGGETALADYLADRLREIGFRDLTRDRFGNLLAILPATDPAASNLLFTAHMDCVYPGNGAPVRPVFCASREIFPEDRTTTTAGQGASGEISPEDRTTAPGYLKYARKELGKLGKLMSDFVLEKILNQRVKAVQIEITKLRQIVIGTSQILCAPSKDVSIIYRSWPGNDCNTGDIKQVLCPDCSFYKIISDGSWKGYFTLVEIRRRNERALLLDVLNFSGLRMENENFIKVLMHQIIQMAKDEGIGCVLASSYESHISNRDYIRRAFQKVFPPLQRCRASALSAPPQPPSSPSCPTSPLSGKKAHPGVDRPFCRGYVSQA